jgi:YcxB-like protein
MLIKSTVGEENPTWDYFIKRKEGKNLLTMYQSDALFHIIPKRFFASAEEMSQFRQLLQKKLGPAGV